jgi:hypothetical protein
METAQINLVLLLVGIAAISSIGTYLFCHRRLRVLGSELERQVASNLETSRSHAAELKGLAQEHREVFAKHASETQQKAHDEYERGRRQGELDTDQKAKAFSVVVRPYVCQTKDGTLFKTYSLEIGYQYQLVVNGIPCFEPHIVIEQRTDEKEVNTELIERITQIAITTARKAVASTPAGNLITVLDSLILTKK